jgi:hypothetical protein
MTRAVSPHKKRAPRRKHFNVCNVSQKHRQGALEMIMNVETKFCKMFGQFRTIVKKLEKALENNTPIHQVEQTLIEEFRVLGRFAIEEFIEQQGDGDIGEIIEQDGKILQRLTERIRDRYFSVFGPVMIKQFGYVVRPTQKIELKPLALKLALPQLDYSYVLQRWDGILTVNNSYGEVAKQMTELLGINQSPRSLIGIASSMAQHARKYQSLQKAPSGKDEAELLVVTIDCKGVPMRKKEGQAKPKKKRLGKGEKKGVKRMACVGGIYTIDRFERTVDDVLNDLHREQRQRDRPEPQNKRLRANLTRQVNGRSLNAKDTTFAWLRHEADQRNPYGDKTVLCIMDGETKLWDKQKDIFPEVVGILDIFHVMEHLWPCVYRFEKENSPEAVRLFEKYLRSILNGRIGRVIGGFRQMAKKRKLKSKALKKLEVHLGYFENNRHRMKYDIYLEKGYSIGSGVVEGACRNLVKDRMERTGMRWEINGAQAVLDLRAIYLNDDWNQFQEYMIKCEQKRLYPHRNQWLKTALS